MHRKTFTALRCAVEFAVLSFRFRDSPNSPRTLNTYFLMAKIFLGIALVVMLATAALGFLTKGKVDTLATSLANTKTALTTTESKLTTAKNDLTKTKEELTAATSKIEEKDKEIATQKTQTEELTKKVAEATTAM